MRILVFHIHDLLLWFKKISVLSDDDDDDDEDTTFWDWPRAEDRRLSCTVQRSISWSGKS